MVELLAFWNFLVLVVLPCDAMYRSDSLAWAFGPFPVAIAGLESLPFPASFVAGLDEAL